ncbi:MAG TPA: hypothetical protein PLU53_06345, partial [Bacteroidia bacterium]|nr:hypothetical protein [Bacteroidia bacterium]
MSFSDVEAARTYYEHAYQIRLKLFGDDDVRTAYSMAQMASYFNFKITVDSAYFLAQKAYLICQQHQEQTHLIDEVKVISTYAYSYKIYFGNRIREFRLSRIEARKIYQVALDKVRKNYGSKSINEAALYRSIGNTYTDQILDLIYNPPQWSLRRIKDPIFREAKAYYIKSAEMIKNTTGGSHPDLSTVYLVTSLLY